MRSVMICCLDLQCMASPRPLAHARFSSHALFGTHRHASLRDPAKDSHSISVIPVDPTANARYAGALPVARLRRSGGWRSEGSIMHGTDARLYSKERNLASNGYLGWLARALMSAWSAVFATTIFALALVVAQVGLIAIAAGLAMYTRSFGAGF